jgi:hypothetical protein
MAFLAGIGGEVVFIMLGRSGSQVFIFVAIITFNPEWFKSQKRFRQARMAVVAIGRYMRADKWKTAELMDLRDIFHDPGFWSMAPCTFQSNCLVMNISVARNAVGFCFNKNQ